MGHPWMPDDAFCGEGRKQRAKLSYGDRRRMFLTGPGNLFELQLHHSIVLHH